MTFLPSELRGVFYDGEMGSTLETTPAEKERESRFVGEQNQAANLHASKEKVGKLTAIKLSNGQKKVLRCDMR